MTDLEFEVLDELYFIQSFEELQQQTALEAETLRKVLEEMCRKGWVRHMETRSGEQLEGGFPAQYKDCYYLASKKGLLAHNSR